MCPPQKAVYNTQTDEGAQHQTAQTDSRWERTWTEFMCVIPETVELGQYF